MRIVLETRRQQSAARRGEGVNPLVAVVTPFDHRTRRALYAAANEGTLRRNTWNGCALNRASASLGRPVAGRRDARHVFGANRRAVSNFLQVWDGLGGTDAECTALLRDAVLAAGLFPVTAAPPADEAPTPAVTG